MNSRERVLMALEHEEPDRIPIDFGGEVNRINVIAYEKLVQFLGFPKGKTEMFLIENSVRPDVNILKHFNVDVYTIYPKSISRAEIIKKEDGYYFTDDWGILWKMPTTSNVYMVWSHPLKDKHIEDIENYNFPDPQHPAMFEGLEKEAKYLYEKTDYAIAMSRPTGGILEVAQWLRGFDKFLTDLMINKKFAITLLNKIYDWYISYWDYVLDIIGDYIQIVSTADDLGMQTGPIVSPKIYQEMIKPFHKKLHDFIKSKADVYINYHTCGSIYKLLPDIIDTGVDAINPVQVSAKNMDTKILKKEFGDKITFWGGGCDSQWILPYGSTKDVELEVRKRIIDLAPGGGFVFAPIHCIQAEVPPQNIVVMFETIKEHGKYPIKT